MKPPRIPGNTPYQDYLSYWGTVGDLKARASVARNPVTPTATQQQLARDEATEVRAALAGNKYAPPDVLHLLADDPDEAVRRALATNPNAPRSAVRSEDVVDVAVDCSAPDMEVEA